MNLGRRHELLGQRQRYLSLIAQQGSMSICIVVTALLTHKYHVDIADVPRWMLVHKLKSNLHLGNSSLS